MTIFDRLDKRLEAAEDALADKAIRFSTRTNIIETVLAVAFLIAVPAYFVLVWWLLQ